MAMMVHTKNSMYYLKPIYEGFEVTKVGEDARIKGQSILPIDKKFTVKKIFVEIGKPAQFGEITTSPVLMVTD